MDVISRSPSATAPESSYEKVVILPKLGDQDPARHAWADARFAADIRAEHALMDEHARFVAHLLDPDEFELIDKAFRASTVFRKLSDDTVGGTVAALAAEPGTVIDSLTQHPEVDAVMSAVQTILDFKTQTVRDIEAGRIKSIIEPRLADHVRREALKFFDELKRAV
ncbi:MAG: DUF2935 domain-containing protein [Gemmatimonadales bacterium]|nr:DUF2935 domain-containing protein [Gemmatimonadales bacterium]